MSFLISSAMITTVLLNSLFEILSASLLFTSLIAELLNLGETCWCWHIFSYYLCFYVGIYASEAKWLKVLITHSLPVEIVSIIRIEYLSH
jgi:hypothetical protein